jgi:hypothetical protein
VKIRPVRLALNGFAIAGLAWLAIGCGGGGGGGGPTQPPPPVVPPSGVTFTPDRTAGGNSVFLGAGSGGSANVFVLDVEAQTVTDLYGVSFVLNYPDDLLGFRKGTASEGPFLDGSFRTELIVKQRSPGELTVGISRINEVPGATGSGLLLSLEFDTRNSGSGSMTLSDEAAIDSFGQEQVDVTFVGGSVNVR